jgi:ferredoxin
MNGPHRFTRYRVEIDAHRCVETGDCERIAPTGFALDSADGSARVLPTVGDTPVDELFDAANACPAQAIRIFDEQGNTLS